jgi:hypothetical protein
VSDVQRLSAWEDSRGRWAFSGFSRWWHWEVVWLRYLDSQKNCRTVLQRRVKGPRGVVRTNRSKNRGVKRGKLKRNKERDQETRGYKGRLEKSTPYLQSLHLFLLLVSWLAVLSRVPLNCRCVGVVLRRSWLLEVPDLYSGLGRIIDILAGHLW